MLPSKIRALRNYLVVQTPGLRDVLTWAWERTVPPLDEVEGLNLENAQTRWGAASAAAPRSREMVEQLLSV